MSERSSSVLRCFAWPNYFVALLLVTLPIVDLVTNVWPIRLSAVEWRYGTIGLLSGFSLTPLLGIVLAVASAAILGHRLAQRVIAVLNLLGAVLFVVLIGCFALDWLQMRATVAPDARTGMDVGSVKALGKHALVVVALVWLGVAGLHASRPDLGPRARRAPASLIREPGGDAPQ